MGRYLSEDGIHVGCFRFWHPVYMGLVSASLDSGSVRWKRSRSWMCPMEMIKIVDLSDVHVGFFFFSVFAHAVFFSPDSITGGHS